LPPFASRDVAYGNPEADGRTLELQERILAARVTLRVLGSSEDAYEIVGRGR
jgi:hypothetical protein